MSRSQGDEFGVTTESTYEGFTGWLFFEKCRGERQRSDIKRDNKHSKLLFLT